LSDENIFQHCGGLNPLTPPPVATTARRVAYARRRRAQRRRTSNPPVLTTTTQTARTSQSCRWNSEKSSLWSAKPV